MIVRSLARLLAISVTRFQNSSPLEEQMSGKCKTIEVEEICKSVPRDPTEEYGPV